MLASLGAKGRLGVEYDSYGLTAAQGRRLDAALAGRFISSTPRASRPACASPSRPRRSPACGRRRACPT